VKWMTGPDGHARVVAALARAFDLLQMPRYAAICRSATTRDILACTAPKFRNRSDLQVSASHLCGSVVLVNHAAEYLPALHWRGQWHDNRLVMVGRPLIPGLVWPVPVIVPRVLGQHYPQVGFVVDQHPVGALRPYGPHPAFGITVRPGCPRRNLHHCHALASEDLVERGGELGVTVADEKPEGAYPAGEVHEQVAGLLGCPCPVWVPGYPEDAHPPCGHLHDEQDIQPLEENCIHGEEVAGQ
jgi:hypothetical protein